MVGSRRPRRFSPARVLGRCLLEKVLDFVDFLVGKPEFACPHNAIGLACIAGANDRGGHGRVTQRPGNCNLAGRTTMAFPDLTQPFNEGEVSRKPGAG